MTAVNETCGQRLVIYLVMTGILKHLLLFSLSKYDRPIRYLLPKLNHPFQTDSIDILTSKLPVYCLPYIKAFIQCLLSFLCSVAVSLVPPLLIRSGIYVTTLCAVVPMNTLLAAVAVCSHTLGWCLVDAWLTLGWRSVDARLMLGWCSVDARMMLGWRSVDARLTLGWCLVDAWLMRSIYWDLYCIWAPQFSISTLNVHI